MSSFFTDIPLCWSFCAMRTVYEYFFFSSNIFFIVVSFSNGRCFFGGMLLFFISLLQLSLLYFLSIRFIIRYKCCVQWYFHRLFSMVFSVFFLYSLLQIHLLVHTQWNEVHTVFTSNKCTFCNCVSVVCYSLPFSFAFFFFVFQFYSLDINAIIKTKQKKNCVQIVCVLYYQCTRIPHNHNHNV